MQRHHLILLTLMIVSLAVTVERPVSAAEIPRPNTIFFVTDDQRNDTLGCTGHPIVKTPTIDRLAAEGVLFENSFCQVPICAANRSTLFTGLSLRTHGHNFGEPPVAKIDAETSYPALLKAAGYRTGFAGKWNHYEQSVPVPLVVFDPSLPKDKRGRVLKELASSMDIAPTIVVYAGLEVPVVPRSLLGSQAEEEITCTSLPPEGA